MWKMTDKESDAYDKMSPEDRHAFRVKKRAESQSNGEKETSKIVAAPQKKGILERVADKAEHARGKYDYVKAQTGRIGKAITPTKTAKPASRVKVVRQPARRQSSRRPARYYPAPRYQYQPVQPRQSYDPFNDLIHGTGSGSARRTSEHINDLTGATRGPSSSFFNDIMGTTPSKGKKKGRDPFKDLLG
jgi:hypothetical protein